MNDRITYENIMYNQRPSAVREAVSSPLFLVLSILMSAMCAFSVPSFNVFNILFTVGMWLAYSSAKAPTPQMKLTGLKMISGTAKAFKIVAIIISIIMIVAGIAGFFALTAYGDELAKAVDEGFSSFSGGFGDWVVVKFNIPKDLIAEEDISYINQIVSDLRHESGVSVGTLASIIVTVACFVTIVAGAVALIFALTFYTSAHKFSRSIVNRSENEISPIEKASSLKSWFIVMGIISAVGAYSAGALTAIAEAAFLIVGYVWIKKYFI